MDLLDDCLTGVRAQEAVFRRAGYRTGGEPCGPLLDLPLVRVLREPGVTVGSAARGAGRTDGLAFGAAFERVRGTIPSAHRTAASGPGRNR
ncbi:hypothetical protein [Streptomyces sp. NPDC014894]|uniref:hypothetical protein n=1 Tax=unclassified Streptomyces TaxID=2593676 RepID=UPI0036F71A4F